MIVFTESLDLHTTVLSPSPTSFAAVSEEMASDP